jgi:hypothetical protein
LETADFQRPSRDFSAAVKTAGKPVQLIAAPNDHRLEMVESLGNPWRPNGPSGARVDEACADMSARLALYGFVPGVFIRPASAGSASQSHCQWRLVPRMGLGHYGVEAVPKPESFPIDKIYVPVKRRKALKPEVVQEIAESILEIGQQAPILVRPDEDRFVLVEGLHRLEACKALGEPAILGLLVSAEVAHHRTLSPQSAKAEAEAEAERQKMERLRKLRLEREAADKPGIAAKAVLATETAVIQREHPEKTARNNLKATPNQSGRGTSGSAPRTLSEWVKQQERGGGRY